MAARLEKRSFTLAGHRTSVALEPAFWAVLGDIAAPRPVSALVVEIDAGRAASEPLASALRLRCLRHALAAAPPAGDGG